MSNRCDKKKQNSGNFQQKKDEGESFSVKKVEVDSKLTEGGKSPSVKVDRVVVLEVLSESFIPPSPLDVLIRKSAADDTVTFTHNALV